MAQTDHMITKASLQPDPHLRTIPLGQCQIEARSNEIKHDLTELGDSFKYITCDNCDINAVCLYSFDIYNTDGDCLLK